jgi:hypothetical protein
VLLRLQPLPKAVPLRQLPLPPQLLIRKVCGDEVITMRTRCSPQNKAARHQEQRQCCERKTLHSCKRSVHEVVSM